MLFQRFVFIAVFALCGAAAVVGAQEVNPLLKAVMSDDVAEIERLVSSGEADVNAEVSEAGVEGWTPLHVAAGFGKLAVANALIENGANPNQSSKGGITPLHIAALDGYPKIIGALAKGKADVNRQDGVGNTPMHTAASEGHSAVIIELSKFGANANIVNYDGLPPLLQAAYFGQSFAVNAIVRGVGRLIML